MNFLRLCQTIRLWTIPGAVKRAEYLRKKNIFAAFGNKCSWMDRRVPLYSKLIKVGDNVHFASHVTFLTHDVAHMMLNRMNERTINVKEKIGCIEIGNNVFIGANSTILYNVEIGNNVIVGAGSLINRDVPNNSIVEGVPAKVIGDFNMFVCKHMQESNSSRSKRTPDGEYINADLQKNCWDTFYYERKHEQYYQQK